MIVSTVPKRTFCDCFGRPGEDVLWLFRPFRRGRSVIVSTVPKRTFSDCFDHSEEDVLVSSKAKRSLCVLFLLSKKFPTQEEVFLSSLANSMSGVNAKYQRVGGTQLIVGSHQTQNIQMNRAEVA